MDESDESKTKTAGQLNDVMKQSRVINDYIHFQVMFNYVMSSSFLN